MQYIDALFSANFGVFFSDKNNNSFDLLIGHNVIQNCYFKHCSIVLFIYLHIVQVFLIPCALNFEYSLQDFDIFLAQVTYK